MATYKTVQKNGNTDQFDDLEESYRKECIRWNEVLSGEIGNWATKQLVKQTAFLTKKMHLPNPQIIYSTERKENELFLNISILPDVNTPVSKIDEFINGLQKDTKGNPINDLYIYRLMPDGSWVSV